MNFSSLENIIKYFSQFNISIKIYKVQDEIFISYSNKEILLRLSAGKCILLDLGYALCLSKHTLYNLHKICEDIELNFFIFYDIVDKYGKSIQIGEV